MQSGGGKNAVDEWDGKFATDSGKITFLLDAEALYDPEKNYKEKEKAMAMFERLKKMQKNLEDELEKRGFPMDAFGQINVTLLDKGTYTSRGGVSKMFSDSIEVQRRPKNYSKDNLDTLLHEIGHKVHERLFPRWTAGDTKYESTNKSTNPNYLHSPREAFANRFAARVKAASNIGGREGLAKIIREVKASVDADVNSGKLNPIDMQHFDEVIKRVNEKKAIKVYRSKERQGMKMVRLPKMQPFYKQDVVKVIKGGKIIEVAKNKIE